MTQKGSFELKLIFFGLTNFLTIFQTMMNEILENLISEKFHFICKTRKIQVKGQRSRVFESSNGIGED